MAFPIGKKMAKLGSGKPSAISTFVRKRRASGMTQTELAELAGVGVRLISELERRKATIRMEAANAVLAIFGKRVGVVDLRDPAS